MDNWREMSRCTLSCILHSCKILIASISNEKIKTRYLWIFFLLVWCVFFSYRFRSRYVNKNKSVCSHSAYDMSS